MATRVRFTHTCAILLAAALLGGCSTAEPRPNAEPVSAAPRIDSRADAALRRMSAALSAARSFSFRSTASMEEPLKSGQLATFTRETSVLVRRPDRIFAESHRGEDVWQLCYAGQSLTILNRRTGTYATAQVPGRIDEMLDEIAHKYELTMPLADLLFSDTYKVLTENVLTGSHVGLHEVDGSTCDHLLFTQRNVDWQIWIRAEGEPVPLKIVIDYRNRTDRPQFTATLKDWNLAAASADDQFTPALPEGAQMIEMSDLLKAAREE